MKHITVLLTANFYIKKLFQVTIISILLSLNLNAQKPTHHHNSVWITSKLVKQVSDNISVKAEVNLRRTNFLSDNQQFIIRPSVLYKINKKLNVALGYSYIRNYSYADFSRPIDASENNIFQQVSLSQPIKFLTTSHRLRLEERFIDKITENTNREYYISGYIYQHRLRYKFGLTLIDVQIKEKKLLRFMVSNEIFLNLKKGIIPKSLNQNRLYFGIKFTAGNHLTLSSGYMNLRHCSLAYNRINHILNSTITYKI